MKDTSKMNAAQRLEALEGVIANLGNKLDNQFQIVADEINRLNELNVALAKRLNAIVKAGDGGQINNQTVKDVIIDEAAKELKSKVDMLIEQGILTLNNDKEIDDNTFVVGKEVNEAGAEVNPRTQFLVGSLQEEVKTMVLGKKAGDSIKDATSNQSLIITETYDVKQIQLPETTDVSLEEPNAPAAGAEVMPMKGKAKKTKKA
jgi:hypothetical protein